MNSTAPAIATARDVDTIARLDAVPALLRVVCDATDFGVAALLRTERDRATVCAVLDRIGLGVQVGQSLELARVVAVHVPIVRRDGSVWGQLCAFGRRSAQVADARTLGLLDGLARVIAQQLDDDPARDGEHAALLDERSTAELREQFIAVLGHDLRNPLNVVATNIQLLAAASQEPDTREIAQRIERSVHRMSALIDDVLDFARGRLGGGLDVRFEEVHDVGQALLDVVDEARSTHPGRRIDFTLDAPHAVRCDRARIQQLAANLLSNALKHGAPAAPVQCSAAVGDEAITLSVTNQGEPIPSEHLRKVFQPFWRQAGSRREGLGLGLFICAEIVRAHGGRIEVMSSRDHGTTFAVHLPVGRR